MKEKNKGITLIALVITIIVMLILVAVTISMAINGGLFDNAGKAVADTQNAIDEEQNLAGGQVIVDGKTYASIEDYIAGKEYIDPTKLAMFDVGTVVRQKMNTLNPEGVMNYNDISALVSVDAIKKYEGKPDSSKLIEANIVSWTEIYNLYEETPEALEEYIPEGMTLCPIYMWFEESGTQEYRDFYGQHEDFEHFNPMEAPLSKTVKTGTLYWWSESGNVYLNFDSSSMFSYMPYLRDISGLATLKTDYVENMSNMFMYDFTMGGLTNVDALLNWNVENVTDLSSMFYGQATLVNVNGLKKWNVGKVSNMGHMFQRATSLADISGLENWNTSNVMDMSYMFGGSDLWRGPSMINLDSLSKWNVSKVQNVNGIFAFCSELQDVSGINDWDLTSVEGSSFTMFADNPEIRFSKFPEFTKISGTWDEGGTFTKSTTNS